MFQKICNNPNCYIYNEIENQIIFQNRVTCPYCGKYLAKFDILVERDGKWCPFSE